MIRMENEAIVALKKATPDQRLPKGILTEGKSAIEDGSIIMIYIS